MKDNFRKRKKIWNSETYEENQYLSVRMVFLLSTLSKFESVIELDYLLGREDDRLLDWRWLLSCLLHFRVKIMLLL